METLILSIVAGFLVSVEPSLTIQVKERSFSRFLLEYWEGGEGISNEVGGGEGLIQKAKREIWKMRGSNEQNGIKKKDNMKIGGP